MRIRGYCRNPKRLYRVYRAMGLNQPRRTKRRVPTRDPQPLIVPQRPLKVWSADFS
jgi:putative transposase